MIFAWEIASPDKSGSRWRRWKTTRIQLRYLAELSSLRLRSLLRAENKFRLAGFL